MFFNRLQYKYYKEVFNVKMRLAPMTVFMFVVYLMIGIFDQTLDPNLNAYGNAGSNFLFATILQPWNWTGTVNILGFATVSMLGILGTMLVVATGIAVAGSVLGRSDITTLYAPFLAFMAIGAAPILVLYSFVTRNVGMFAGCTIGEICGPAQIIGALTAGVLAIMWLYTCMEWWAWRATTQ